MKKIEFQVIETGRGSEEVTSFDKLEAALEHMRYIDRMLTDKEKKNGSSVYVGKAEYETNDSEDRRDWEDLHDGYVDTWQPEAEDKADGKETGWQREISSRFAAARKASGMTFEELAKSIGSSRQQVAKYESGEQGMTVIRMIEIAEALGVDPATLLPEIY